jgi:hypothetical protein
MSETIKDVTPVEEQIPLKEQFSNLLDRAIEMNRGVVMYLVTPETKESGYPEIIITVKQNVKAKKDFYLNNYDEELKHVGNSEVQIVEVHIDEFDNFDLTPEPLPGELDDPAVVAESVAEFEEIVEGE